MLQAALYAEIYGICFVVVALLLFWSLRSDSRSSSEQWLIRLFSVYLFNFAANICFTLFNRGLIATSWVYPLSYLFKTLYFVSFIVGTFCWCGYAEAEMKTELYKKRWGHVLFVLPFALPLLLVALNLWNHRLFFIDEFGSYRRGEAYHWMMAYLCVATGSFAMRHFMRSTRESDPVRREHMRLTASFPLSIFAAWLFSLAGEAVPVICVCLMVELLCLYVVSNKQMISIDKLTQVNNRQNLISFMNYKLNNHDNPLFLLMVDVDEFKGINDTYGHLEGDNALIRVATALKRACIPYKLRPYIARYGGDEFIVVMEGSEEEAATLCDSIRRILRKLQERDRESQYSLEVSIGLAQCQEGMHASDLIAAADAELYKTKRARRRND